ncbi:MAG: DUF2236 domain-containing protein [Chitinophagaceae bacterium]|jgi:uncharacterized protein (DUF2236 family)|nr:DUF2236 domain-containing protein [Chitinophagaceae bacterium]
MEYFVDEKSVVRKIWGSSDTILIIFAGASAEFALNKSVDWLYFTGRLPADPIGRLFSTVSYARKIVFATLDEANKTIDIIRKIHGDVESGRGKLIPERAYRDVLYMLIYYSIQAYEMLETKMSLQQKEDVYDVFFRMGERMGISGLPVDFSEWLQDREKHLKEDLVVSGLTNDLFTQYQKHLGWFRYRLLLAVQRSIVPESLKSLLGFRDLFLKNYIFLLYKMLRKMKLSDPLKFALIPATYKVQVKELDRFYGIKIPERCPFHIFKQGRLGMGYPAK